MHFRHVPTGPHRVFIPHGFGKHFLLLLIVTQQHHQELQILAALLIPIQVLRVAGQLQRVLDMFAVTFKVVGIVTLAKHGTGVFSLTDFARQLIAEIDAVAA
ncbi:hypothetical protein D3C75_1118150 [compost metagenome]